jgi:uncharacterized protein
VLVDANVLLYAVDSTATQHAGSAAWLRQALEGERRIGIPWQTIGAFIRIATHPRLFRRPLTTAEATGAVEAWLASPVCWVPAAGLETTRILGRLLTAHDLRGNLVTDAQLAALAVEHGVPVISTDTDFARFPEVTWINPLRLE